jgi:hypothetical protein
MCMYLFRLLCATAAFCSVTVDDVVGTSEYCAAEGDEMLLLELMVR